MPRNIDHIVIVVRDLAQAMADYESAGLTATLGGEHVGGATRNALVAFEDGTYFELIAFKEPDRPQPHRWWARLTKGEGLADYALGSESLAAEAARLRERNVVFEGPRDGGRRRPDGQEIAWRLLNLGRGRAPGDDQPALPFMIEDVTPRPLRVPEGAAARHRCGATRVAGLTVVTDNLAAVAPTLAAALGATSPTEASRAGAQVVRLPVGQQWIELLQPTDTEGPAAAHLRQFGAGPFEIVLASGAAEPGSGALLASGTHGARIRVQEG